MAATADVIIVGAGIIGMTLARELRLRGRQVLVLERDLPGRQSSWAGAGELSEGYGAPATDPHARLSRFSCSLFPELVRQLSDETGIDSGYRDAGHLVPALTGQQARALEETCGRLQAERIEAELVTGQAVYDVAPALGPTVQSALLIPGANLDNRQLMRALELAERRHGVQIESATAVTGIRIEAGRVVGVQTLAGDFHAPVVVVAAGAWSAQLVPSLPVVPQRGQILAVRGDEIGLRRCVLAIGDPYVLPRVDGRLIIGATREFAGWQQSLTAGGIAWLLQSAIEIIPAIADAPILEMWTGFRPFSLDRLPIIGESDVSGLFIATGHGSTGLSQAPGTARFLAALICGEPLPIPAEPYSPRRFDLIHPLR